MDWSLRSEPAKQSMEQVVCRRQFVGWEGCGGTQLRTLCQFDTGDEHLAISAEHLRESRHKSLNVLRTPRLIDADVVNSTASSGTRREMTHGIPGHSLA